VRTEVVVGRFEPDGAIDFEESLSVLIGLFYVTVFHFPNAFLGGGECCGEGRVKHQASAAAFSRAIRRLGATGDLTR
jgi:hypothetical protein